jgi:hypothetical protein
MKTKLILPILAVIIITLFCASTASAATRYSVATGNWSSTSTWSSTHGGGSGSSVPVAGDTVIIDNTTTVTIDVATAACATVDLAGLNAGDGPGTIVFNSGSQLTVSGALTVGQNSFRKGSINMTSGGLLQCGSTVTVNFLGTFTAGTGTIAYNAAGAQTVTSALGAYQNLILSGSGAKTMTGITTIGGALTVSGSATMTGNAAFTVTGAFNYGSSGSSTLTATTAISIGSFNQTAGTLIDSANTITVTGTGVNVWLKSGGTFTATGTAIFTGAAPQIGAGNFNNLTINVGAGNTATLTGSPSIAGNLTVSTGSLDLSTFTADRATTGGTLSVAASAGLLVGGTANFPTNYTTVTLNATSTVNYDNAGAQTISARTYGNLTTSGSGTKTLGGAIIVAGNLSIGASTTLDTTAANNYAVTLNGNFSNSGTFTANGSAITIGGGAAQSIAGFTTTGTVSMTKTAGTATFTGNVNGGGLTINGTGGTLNLGAGLTHTFTGTWTRTAGTLNGGSSTLKIGGSVSGSTSTFTAATGTVEWNAAGAQAIAAVAYNNLIFSGSSAKSMATGTSVTGNLSIAPTGSATASVGTALSLNVGSLTLGGVTQVTGTWGSTSSAATHKTDTYFAATTGVLNVTGVTGGATHLVYTVVPGSGTAGTAFSVTVQSQDALGNPANLTSSTTITLTKASGAGTLSGTLTGSIGSGANSVTISTPVYSAADAMTLTATASGGVTLTAVTSGNIVFSAGAVTAAQSTVAAAPTSVTADGSTTSMVTVTLKDANNNPVSGKTVTLAKSGGSSTLSAASGPSDVNGVVTFTVRDIVVETTTYTATDTTDSVTITQTADVTFTAAIPWYNTSWTNRLAIVIDHTKVSGPLTNFPVLINLTNASLQASAQSSGNDLLFTSADGTNKLAHEIESYTNSNGALVAWVNVPILSSTADTTLYLYYGNSSATNQQNVSGVWNSNFTAVWHLSNNNFNDSTINANNGTNSGTTNTTGIIGGARGFDGVSAYIYTTTQYTNPQNFTLQAWFKTSTASGKNILGYETDRTGTASGGWDRQIYVGTDGKLSFQCSSATDNTAISPGTYTNNAWHQVFAVRDNSSNKLNLYVDGQLVATTNNSNASVTNGYWRIGSYKGASGNGTSGYFPGSVDEVRIALTARSAAWISAEYNTQNSPATFYSVGSAESAPPTKLAITAVNGGSSPTVGATFSVIVQSQNAGGTPRNVTTNTAVTLSLSTGTGTLGGTLTGTITNGTSSVTISGVTYNKAENGVILTATRTSGNTLTVGNSSSFNVSKAVLTVSSGLIANNKVYDATTAATISSNTVVLAGVLAGDTGNVSLSTNSYTATFASAGTNNNIAVSVSGLTLTGSAAGNYTLTQPSLSANITAATVTVASGLTGNNKVYDGTTSATISSNNVVLSGVLAGDAANVKLSTNGYTATFASATVGSGKTVTVSGLTLTGSAAANYTLTQPSLSANITAVTVTVSSGLTANNKVYDATTAATISSNNVVLAGVLAGDAANVKLSTNGYTATFASATVGNGKTVTVSGLTLTGSAATNYTLTQPSLSANITAASTSVVVSSSKNPSGYKDSVTFTATLPAAATGSVVFFTNGAAFGSAVTLSSGSATSLSITNLPRGTNTITAQYAGDGNYLGSTNNLSGGQVVTNHPPVAGVTTIYRTAGLRLKIAWSDVTTNWSDSPDGDPVTLTSMSLVTTNLINLTTNSTFILYTNSPNVNDQITYTISDGQGGTNTGVINVVINPFVTGQLTGSITVSGSSVTVTNYGIPTFTYVTQRSTNLVNWVSIATNTVSSNGVINVTDTFGDLGGPPASAYYRLGWSP